MRIFISAGEPSGDLHAANLIRSLRVRVPDVQFDGFGGDRMTEAGARLLYPLANLAVMWFLNVFMNLVTFIRLIFLADRHFRDQRPDAVVLVDYPGLHWWIAGRAKARGIPVFYFVPPQIWAWGSWRVQQGSQVRRSGSVQPSLRARLVSRARCRRGGPRRSSVLSTSWPTGPWTPASSPSRAASQARWWRSCPVRGPRRSLRNLPDMIRAARKLARERPDVRFAVACLHERHKALAEEIIAQTICQ